MRPVYILGLAAALGAHSATAQSPSALSAEGRVSLGYSDRVPGAETFLFGDATLRLDARAFGFGVPLGFELGVYGRATALDTPHETYGALTWDLARAGRILVGVPRPAYDSFAVSALEGGFPDLAIDQTAATRSLATSGAMFGGFLPYGARFENTVGPLRYAVSVHNASNANTTIAGLGLSYPLGDWTISGAVEAAWGAGSTDISAKLQAAGNIGPAHVGVGVYAPGATGATEFVEGFASIVPIDRLTLSGVVQVPLSGAVDPTLGLSASYSLRPNIAASVGVVSDAGADAAFNALIDFKF